MKDDERNKNKHTNISPIPIGSFEDPNILRWRWMFTSKARLFISTTSVIHQK
jgi:hypothetical protein